MCNEIFISKTKYKEGEYKLLLSSKAVNFFLYQHKDLSALGKPTAVKWNSQERPKRFKQGSPKRQRVLS